jgi:uncharacterized membrane protein YraQ (UPF0718 family)
LKQEQTDSSGPSAGQLIPDIGSARTPQHPKKRRVFDAGFLAVSAIMFIAVGIVYYQRGAQYVLDILAKDSALALDIAPKVLAAVLLAAWLRRILPKEVIARHFGHQSGIRGMSLAVFAGIILPGGPMTAFPLAIAFSQGGAALAVIIAFLTSWLLLSANRTIVWEMAFIDSQIVGWRLLLCLPVPFLLGFAAQYLYRGNRLISDRAS